MIRHSPRRRIAQACIATLCAATTVVHADTTEMLPAGVTGMRYQYTVAHAEKRFDTNGDRKSLGDLYRAALQANGLPSSVPGVYHIATDVQVDVARHDIYLQYGVTDRFNIALWTHYIDQHVGYSANLIRENGWSTLPAANQSRLSEAVTAADAASASAADLGDTIIGYKQLLTPNDASTFRFAYYLGVRLPTGHVANPLKRGDLSTGDGQTDIGVWFSLDWHPSRRWLLNMHTRHEYQLPGTHNVLDPNDSSRTLAQRFQPGLYNYVELMARYTIPGPGYDTELELSVIHEHTAKERAQTYDAATDSYSGALHAVDNTQSALLTLQPQIGIDVFPMDAKLYAGIPVAGQNSVALQYMGIRFDACW